tara:strand:+ start:930 stop:2468 length:1539 start_codon:yes stop_codon:yes gene_type:complete
VNVYVPLKKAFEQSRFKEVIGGVVSALESTPLNDLEIIQLGELALEAMKRDQIVRDDKLRILRKLANSYSNIESHAKAKKIFEIILSEEDSWTDLLGLLRSLASEGEIENLKETLASCVESRVAEKNVVQLKKIAELLNEFGLLSKTEAEIRLYISLNEGDVERAINISNKENYGNDFVKDAPWEESVEAITKICKQLTDDEAHRKLFVKKIYSAFMIHGTNQSLLVEIINYYLKTNSRHIGYFLKENSGLKVELPEEQWINEAFKKSLSVEQPTEIDVEIDLGEDLFGEQETKSVFEQIKTLENRISFLLNQNKADDAKRLIKELLRLDPSNKKFKSILNTELENVEKNQLGDGWKDVLKTLEEIDSHGKVGQIPERQSNFSWKLISNEDLSKHYRDYCVALIQSREFESCIELLEKVLVLSDEAFKDASYLKARCFFELNNFTQAKVVAESIIESCVLDTHELNEVRYLCAECLEATGQIKSALKIYKEISKNDANYRLLKLKLRSLEQN